MSAPIFMSTHLKYLEIFYWINKNSDLLMVFEKLGITRVIRVHPLGKMNENISNICFMFQCEVLNQPPDQHCKSNTDSTAKIP